MEIVTLLLAALGIGLTLFDHGSDVGLGMQYYGESTYSGNLTNCSGRVPLRFCAANNDGTASVAFRHLLLPLEKCPLNNKMGNF